MKSLIGDYLTPSSPPLPLGLQQQLIFAYMTSVQQMDKELKRILDALDRLGMRKKTFVVFLSDHGWSLGEHAMYCKQSLFDTTTHVPLLISSPSSSHISRTVHSPVSLLDIAPTVLALFGHTRDYCFKGESLVEFLRVQPPAKVKHKVYSISQFPRCPSTPHGKCWYINLQSSSNFKLPNPTSLFLIST